jgi:hypothetical protein
LFGSPSPIKCAAQFGVFFGGTLSFANGGKHFSIYLAAGERGKLFSFKCVLGSEFFGLLRCHELNVSYGYMDARTIFIFFQIFFGPCNPVKTGYLPCRPLALQRPEAANLAAFLPGCAVMLAVAGLGLACPRPPAPLAEGGGGFADVGLFAHAASFI